jgi:uroporphyrinogen decarboxylase
MGLPARLPGRDLDKNAQYQFIEKPNMTHDDYRFIIKNGWDAWYNSYLMRIQNPPIKGNFNLILRFINMGSNTGKNIKHFTKTGMVPIYETAMAPAFDILSMVRSMEEYLMDLYEEGGLVQDVLRRATPAINKLTLTNIKRAKGTRAGNFAMRTSCSFLSPAVFEEFAWPYLKQTIEEFWKAGITTVLHADGNWLPLIKYFRELPKGCVHFELDGVTNIYQAHAILDGWQSIRGDVSATMLAYGKPDEVSAYCEKLITEIGLKGGFMLGSGCEVPLNAKLENVMAMIDAVR